MFKAFKSIKTLIDIYINDEKTEMIMALGKKGEAFFISVNEE